MKEKIITIVICVAVVAAIIVSVKFLPLWSTFLSTAVAAASFVAGWFGKKWYDHHVKP